MDLEVEPLITDIMAGIMRDGRKLALPPGRSPRAPAAKDRLTRAIPRPWVPPVLPARP